MSQITVKIAGANYRMACDDGQESHIESLAEALNIRIADLKMGFGEIGDQRLIVMAAIIALDELSEAKTKINTLDGQIKAIRNQRLTATETSMEQATHAIHAIAERVESIAKSL